ncbi:hypothetical protein EHS13_02900 [Paenibacillus psychroresistens]|uniref:Uncharacterized protein n=1 Tax=Paenibacillus psychroresistens TaxID=1778678 RepID=A0A6B8REF3_9BACL|nr:hypothetical protein [Paenibacillus psychroresistens]QGQ93925.1 hypothetical protein EHS13_02900 [Paenibacillus psychroresistens]
MSDNEIKELNQAQPGPNPEETELITNVFNLIQGILKEQFPEHTVAGQVGQHQQHGPMLAFTLEEDEKTYTCGFFLAELVHQFQSKPHAPMWLSSFFVDLLDSPESKPLPNPPQTEDDAKEIFDKYIIPHCAQSVREEFDPEPVLVDLGLNQDHGPVLEASFVSIIDGNNTCAIPLHYLLTLHLMNRDPADPIIQALYQIKDSHAAEAATE